MSVQPGFGTRFHCCASCRHFSSGREEGETFTRCSRLGYETKAKYQFNCWNPKEKIKRKILLNFPTRKDEE